MQLREIEQFVLNAIGYDRYSSLSVDTNPEKIEDFASLHTCVNFAREEIKLNTKIPALTKIGTAIITASGNPLYSLPSDFDIPITFYYWASGNTSAYKLTQLYVENLPDKVPVAIGSAAIEAGTPANYIIADTSSDLIQVILNPEPNVAGVLLPVYKPVLTEVSLSTAECVLMRKYPKTVIDFATAFAFQLIKKDSAQHDKYYAMGMAECSKIDFREKTSDSNFKELPPLSIRNNRLGRASR